MVSFRIYINIYHLTLSMLDKIVSRRYTEIYFLFFSQKTGFDVLCKLSLWRQFAWNVKVCFLGNIYIFKVTSQIALKLGIPISNQKHSSQKKTITLPKMIKMECSFLLFFLNVNYNETG